MNQLKQQISDLAKDNLIDEKAAYASSRLRVEYAYHIIPLRISGMSWKIYLIIILCPKVVSLPVLLKPKVHAMIMHVKVKVII